MQKESLYLNLGFIKWLQQSRQCGTGAGVETQTNGTGNPEVDAHKYRQLIFDKDAKVI